MTEPKVGDALYLYTDEEMNLYLWNETQKNLFCVISKGKFMSNESIEANTLVAAIITKGPVSQPHGEQFLNIGSAKILAGTDNEKELSFYCWSKVQFNFIAGCLEPAFGVNVERGVV